MLSQIEVYELFSLWSKISYSKLLNVDQISGFKIEFIIDENILAKSFLKNIQKITIKKHPSGSVAFIEYWGQSGAINSQYRKYRIEFIDSSIKEEKLDEDKLRLYFENLKNELRGNSCLN